MSIASPSDGFVSSISFPLHSALPDGETIPQSGQRHTAADVAAFVDRMLVKVTAHEDVAAEILAFGLTAKLLGRLMIYRKRLQTAVVRNLDWHHEGKLLLPLEETPVDAQPPIARQTTEVRSSVAQLVQAAQPPVPSLLREGFPRIANVRELPLKRLLEYLQVLAEDTKGGGFMLDAHLAQYGIDRAIYHELLEHMHQLEWAASNDLSIWDARGRLQFPRIPKGRVAPKAQETAPASASTVSHAPAKPSGNGKDATITVRLPKPEGLREKNRREAFALFLAASEVRRCFDFSTQQVCGLFGIAPAKFYSYEAQFGDLRMTAADKVRRDALLERVQVAAEQMRRDIETSRSADKRSVFQKILEDGHDDDFEARNDDGFSSTDALPGTKQKIDVLAERVIHGNPLWHEGDRSSQDALSGGLRQQQEEVS